jgi:hypothetical protein
MHALEERAGLNPGTVASRKGRSLFRNAERRSHTAEARTGFQIAYVDENWRDQASVVSGAGWRLRGRFTLIAAASSIFAM